MTFNVYNLDEILLCTKMNTDTPPYSQSLPIMQQPYQPIYSYQQNHPSYTYPQNYYNDGNSFQHPTNNTNIYYNNSSLNSPYISQSPSAANELYTNGYVNPSNVPYSNGCILPSTAPMNSCFNVNGFAHSPTDVFFENFTSPTSQQFIVNSTSASFNKNYIQHPQDPGCCNNKYTSVPQPPHTNSYGKDEKPKEVDDWFDLTNKFLSTKTDISSGKCSSVVNRNQYDLKYGSRTQSSKGHLLNKSKRRGMKTAEELSAELEILSKMSVDQIINAEKKVWTRSAPADLYYEKPEENPKITVGKENVIKLCDEFDRVLGKRATAINALKPLYNKPRKNNVKVHKHKCSGNNCSDDDSSSCDDGNEEDDDDSTIKELDRKSAHPDRLHSELWYNEVGEMNDGPMCKCSVKSQRTGIRHNIYVGEGPFEPCSPISNNSDKLYHYRITITPPTNFLLKCPTIITHDNQDFIFEGFSLLSHYPIPPLPTCKVIRFNTNYAILYVEEKIPDNFIVKELQLFYDYLFRDILELVDLDLHAIGNKDGCPQFHFMPRFVRDLPGHGKEILSMNEVLKYLLNNNKLLFEEYSLSALKNMSMHEWQNIVDEYKGMVVTNPGSKPCSIRVDQLDRDAVNETNEKMKNDGYPVIVHFGIRPPQLSYAGNPDYQKGWRDYVKFRHLLANMPKPSFEDKRKLEIKERALQEMRSHNKMKRGVTAAVSSKGFYKTGLMCDIVQHAMLLPVLVCHFRFHKSLEYLENTLEYKFKNKYLLQLALTHPSYRENFGTNPDHARNALTNCGIRQPEYGDRRIHYMNTRKRGINTLINIMSRFGKKSEMESNIMHNERLEFLGDAVVEFVSSIHLFNMFPDIEEGGLATFRAAIVQNQHLAVLAKTLKLDDFMLYAHGSDLCHDSELKHAMANCFEALMGALFLDGGIEVADRVFGKTFFRESPELLNIWVNYPKHPLQQQEPNGDRKWIKTLPLLQKLTKFEDAIGIQFNHIRLLARAFTDRSVGFTNLTLGSNQRLEFLGDTVLQLIASDYLYKYFPEHHEGHLSLLRSSLVNNRTQSVVCDDLGMVNYALYANPKAELKTKDRADLLEAFLGALYIDKGLKHCQAFCNVCFFPRLHDFILKQDWNDPKSKLQQCCLTLRSVDGGEPDIPVYKVIECMGPTNGRKYTVAVYFKGVRLSQATGHSIQRAEMNAANSALEVSKDLFPQLDHQRRAISRSLKHQCKSSDGQTNIDDIIKILESKSLKNEAKMTKLDWTKIKLQRKLLAVLCSNKTTGENEKTEEPKKKKHRKS
ncbi:ribonuclease 3 [Adelges cooleyi]|uniref:ribonuclease 3 n=1 Tax=Adelges cooleyi TaxID=133065 RepID=UPI0021806E5C|nr:ribonuclease 3 [Adelges cooleyi]XP_050428633.1 ribonuclease 3 [Adelges cooleyi]